MENTLVLYILLGLLGAISIVRVLLYFAYRAKAEQEGKK